MIIPYTLVIQVSMVCGINTDRIKEYKYSNKEYYLANAKYEELLLTVGKVEDNCIVTDVKAGHRVNKPIDKGSNK